jgi:hypothetical protein
MTAFKLQAHERTGGNPPDPAVGQSRREWPLRVQNRKSSRQAYVFRSCSDSARVARQHRHQFNCYSCSKRETGGCRFPRISPARLPYAYHERQKLADFQLIRTKSLILLVSAMGFEPMTL